MIGDLRPGDPGQVGRYRLVGRLGSGGMGQVYLGQSPGGRPVAVKLIRADLADRQDFRIRFAREVAAARRVSGIFTAHVVDADSEAEHPWLVTAYVPGPSLAEVIESQGPMPAHSVLSLAAGLAEGLAAIHAAGVVHRDLKPSNVLLAPDGPRIIDFGISRPMDADGLTGSGAIIGSPGFMSPEQADGRPVGPETDIFSLGSVLTFAATGNGPFGAGLPAVLIYRITHLAPDLGATPSSLRPLIERCLARDAQARPTADAVLAGLPALTRALEDPGQAAGPCPLTVTSDGYRLASRPDQSVAPAPAPRLAGRRRRAAYVAAAIALIVVAGGFGASKLLGHSASASPPTVPVRQSPGPTSPSGTASRSGPTMNPGAVVRAYFGAINARDYLRAWQLGGDNLGEPYSSFVAGFTKTSRVAITSLHATGNHVRVRTLAYETTGQVQAYALSYVVRDGVIVSGHSTLLHTSP